MVEGSGLACQDAAAALPSVFMIHPMILSISVLLPCLCDLTQLYKPRAVYHLGQGKWLSMDHGCMPSVLAETLLADCFSRQSGVAAFRLHPSFTLADTGHRGWQDSSNKGPATFVPSAKNKGRWKIPLWPTPRKMQSVVLGAFSQQGKAYRQVDNLLHNMVCGVSQED